jgi:tetratricopeptide (TPR) repeat protein
MHALRGRGGRVSFFKRIFGGKTPDEERAAADLAFEQRRWGDARMGYERAIDAAPEGELAGHCRARIASCFDAQSEERIAEAKSYALDGMLDLARAELESAIELARSSEIRERARRTLETLERKDAKANARPAFEMSDDERFALIAGTWTEPQIEEYDTYGEPFRNALLQLHDEQAEPARAALEVMLSATPNPTYLWLEVARARLLASDDAAAREALERFLGTVPPDVEGDAILGAYVTLATLADRAKDEERAMHWLGEAVERMPEDPRPFLQLGVYLRQRGHAADAVEVLETALELLSEDQPSWEARQELALAKRDAGDPAAAIELLEGVIRFFVQRSMLDFPPSTALPLAELHEAHGKLERAADLYRSLAHGSDRARHFDYHVAASRVLEKLGLLAESRRMLTRAAALVEAEADKLSKIEAQLVELDARL